MNVAHLRQHLDELARLLDLADGGKKVVGDLRAITEGLAPFDGQTLPQFAGFLARAHGYDTTGKLTAPAKPARAPRAAKPKADPAELARLIRELYDRSGDRSLPMEEIEAGLQPLAGLPKAGLTTVCQALEIRPVSKWKLDDYRAAIRQRVLDRRSAAQRAAMIEGG
jgi:hypothetical protein